MARAPFRVPGAARIVPSVSICGPSTTRWGTYSPNARRAFGWSHAQCVVVRFARTVAVRQMARGAKERTFPVRTDHNVTEFERVEDLVVQNWFCGVRKRRFGFMAAGRQFERGSV